MGGIGTRWGDKGRYIYGETMGRRDLGKVNTPSNASSRVPQYGERKGNKGRQADTPSNTGTHMWEDNGRQDLGKADAASNTGTHVGDDGAQAGERGRQDLGKADTPSNTQHTCNETIGDTGRQTSGRRTHHPTQAHLCGDHERQASNTNSHVGRHWETRGGKTSGKRMHHLWRGSERQPSTTGTHVGRKWETGGSKTSGRWTNTGTHVGKNGR